MKKRIFALVMVLALSISMLAACGGGGGGESSDEGGDITLTFLDKHPEEEDRKSVV